MPDAPDIPSAPPSPKQSQGLTPNKPEAPAPQGAERPLPIIKHPPFLWEKTQSLIREIEQKIQSKLLVYYTHPSSSITNEDVDYFFSHIRDLQPESSLSLILVSNGGSGTAAWRIANLLRNYCKNLTIVVPSGCASAATLLALSAERILFGPAGYLTAIDISLIHPLNPRPNEKSQPTSISADQINRVQAFINDDLKNHPGNKSVSEILFERVHPIILGELQRSSSMSKMIAKNMIRLRSNTPAEEEQNRLANILNDTYPSHGYPIVLKEAVEIGLPAEATPSELNPLLWELIKLYSLISRKTTTNLTPTFYHEEGTPVIIESTDKRTFYAPSYNKRFLPQTGLGWITENDKTSWLCAMPDPLQPGKPKINQIDL